MRPPDLVTRRDEHDGPPAVLPRDLAGALGFPLGGIGNGAEADHLSRSDVLLADAGRKPGQAKGEQQIRRPAFTRQLQTEAESVVSAAQNNDGVDTCGHAVVREDEQPRGHRAEGEENR